MKYTEIELQCEDLLWFAVDNNELIISFTTGGIGCVPEFIINSKENTLALQKFFLEEFASDINGNDDSALSEKGIYCFDVDYNDNYGNSYKIISEPNKPIHLKDLPYDIQKVLKNNYIDVDVCDEKRIIIKHSL